MKKAKNKQFSTSKCCQAVDVHLAQEFMHFCQSSLIAFICTLITFSVSESDDSLARHFQLTVLHRNILDLPYFGGFCGAAAFATAVRVHTLWSIRVTRVKGRQSSSWNMTLKLTRLYPTICLFFIAELHSATFAQRQRINNGWGGTVSRVLAWQLKKYSTILYNELHFLPPIKRHRAPTACKWTKRKNK